MAGRSFRTRLAKLEAPLAGPTVAEIEQEAEFLLLLDSRFGRDRGGIGDTEAERAAMQLLRTATTFEERKAALEAWNKEERKSPDYGKDPAEILSVRHKPFRCKEPGTSRFVARRRWADPLISEPAAKKSKA